MGPERGMYLREDASAWYIGGSYVISGATKLANGKYTLSGAEAPPEYRARGIYGRPGTILRVRETWSPDLATVYPFDKIVYRAGMIDDPVDDSKRHEVVCKYEKTGVRWGDCLRCATNERGFRWRSATTMRPGASRLTLKVTATRIERLHAITEAAARAEGIEGSRPVDGEPFTWRDYDMFPNNLRGVLRHDSTEWFGSPLDSYKTYWKLLHGSKASWESNPLVWVITFERMHTNGLWDHVVPACAVVH